MIESTRSEATDDMTQEAAGSAAQEAAEDLAELQFSPLAPEEAAELDDRVYLLGVRREYMNVR